MRTVRALPIVALCAALSAAGCAATEHGEQSLREFFEPTVAQRAATQRSEQGAFEESTVDTTVLEVDAAEMADEPRVVREDRPRERPQIAGDATFQLEFRDASLAEAVHMIAAQAGVNVYLDAGLADRVDASFPAVTLDAALDVLLSRNELLLVEQDGVFWVTRDDGSEIETARFELSSISSADVVDKLKELVGEEATVVTDDRQNFIVVRGPRRAVDLVEEFLANADQLQKQVLIEVKILEFIYSEGMEVGFVHLLNEPDFLGEGTLDLSQDLSTLDTSSFSATLDLNHLDLTSTLNALETSGIVNLISTPRVIALSNQEANIEVVREVPYIEATVEISGDPGSSGTTSTESVEFKESGIKLKVTPIIQQDGVIALSVDKEFSEVVDFFQNIPVLDTRTIKTQFLVEDAQTAVLGGLMQNRNSNDDAGVPLLQDIPFVGRLFRSDTDVIERRELIVFLTPRIVDPLEAAELAGRYHADYEQKLSRSGADAPPGH